jgi:hypothetical protein
MTLRGLVVYYVLNFSELNDGNRCRSVSCFQMLWGWDEDGSASAFFLGGWISVHVLFIPLSFVDLQ